jgi:hypothetical protein
MYQISTFIWNAVWILTPSLKRDSCQHAPEGGWDRISNLLQRQYPIKVNVLKCYGQMEVIYGQKSPFEALSGKEWQLLQESIVIKVRLILWLSNDSILVRRVT